MDGEVLLSAVIAAGLTPSQTDAFIDSCVLRRRGKDLAREYGKSRQAVYQQALRARYKLMRVVQT